MKIKKALYIDEFGYSFQCSNILIDQGLIWTITVKNNFPVNSDSNTLKFSEESYFIEKIKSDYKRRGMHIFTQIEE